MDFDFVIIGAGPAGEAAAYKTLRRGARVAVVELGRLKADQGNQNYPVSDGTDVAKAQRVVVWCKQFGVLFATARLD